MSAIMANVTRCLLQPTITHLPPSTSTSQSRNINLFGWGKKDEEGLSKLSVTSISELLKQSTKTKAAAGTYNNQPGGLAESSIFGGGSTEVTAAESDMGALSTIHISDPNRENWEVQHYGPLTKKEMLLHMDKEHLAKFSAKAARDVLGRLYAAKKRSVVSKRIDPWQTYIEQEWVGRGTYGRDQDHEARGRIAMLRLPYTMILKRKITRDRIAKEKGEKRLRKKPWEQLPSLILTANQITFIQT
ncbi:hypothetical protein L873DRAFT_1831901 [Choiromyces venosus 120613-1]|uniref:Ribosomal protein L22 n=1 Tax=Choiromyces venosus 120613-1 TaxID=1336337 RepID=A0A3N4IUC9_9PEZI|nr:hypothetical protein L873DRAFT_1831901 [Choiromyces venosus 120613-1]